MSEVLARRYAPERMADERFGARPDLLILDGGKPQLTAAMEQLGELGLNIPMAGLAKSDEELFVPWDDMPVVLPSGSASLYLVKRVRDEAHRFAITFHRELRGKAMTVSILDEVPGVGEKRQAGAAPRVRLHEAPARGHRGPGLRPCPAFPPRLPTRSTPRCAPGTRSSMTAVSAPWARAPPSRHCPDARSAQPLTLKNRPLMRENAHSCTLLRSYAQKRAIVRNVKQGQCQPSNREWPCSQSSAGRIIVDLVGRNDTASVSELAERFEISESTIRRDIDRLEAAGLLVKVHGGAASVDAAVSPAPFVANEPTMAEKRDLNAAEKRAIAAYAAGLIEPDDFVFLDAGSTTQIMVELLGEPALCATYVTNSVSNALALAARGVHVIVIGGDLKAGTEAIVGPGAIDALSRYNFSKGFAGANGVTREQGLHHAGHVRGHGEDARAAAQRQPLRPGRRQQARRRDAR